jgi:hypothetical protein
LVADGLVADGLVADGLGVGALGVEATKAWRLRIKAWVPAGLAGVAAVASLMLRIGFPVEREGVFYNGSAALASVPAELRARPVLNEYGFGGLLIFDGVRPFVDGRADLYGDDFLDMYHDIAHGKGISLETALCRYDIAWTMFTPDSVVPALMDRTAGWHRLYSDKVAVIHVRDGGASQPGCTSANWPVAR